MNDVDEMGVYLNGVKVSVIMYADDLVLISQTKHGLQLGMNVSNIAHSKCNEFLNYINLLV